MRRRGDVFGGADRQPVIRMIRRIERRDDRHAREAVGPILVLLPPLVEHDVALVLELRVGERRQQIAHAIRLHPQGELERVRRHDLPVVGAIGVGRAVERARRPPAADGSSPCRSAASPRTSGARRDGRTPCGRAARSSSRRGTRRSPRRWGSSGPHGSARPGRCRVCGERMECSCWAARRSD